MRITISSDKELVSEIRAAMKENGGYCPCSLKKSDDTRCMCKQFREMEKGTCHCGLYTKYEEE